MTRNLTATLVDELRARIVDGSLAPGEKLPSENTLIAEHGVSRTVVREAITRLQAEGLVHTRRGAGSFVLIPPAAAEGGAAA
ncbi:winged helix-turn-helix domain-containing protein, partial [Arthrobacter sp. GCM10027362]|uniref:winged helix-turn-helix domain-containing protein n=1 Tax=Arthrobacter sp. GCM10027362 TaxID=3273379 RepID=UPI0036256BF9